MKTNFWGVLIVMLAFVTGFSINNIAHSESVSGIRIAVVDIPAIVSNSQEIKSLKSSQEKRYQSLETIFNKAKAEIDKEPDPYKVRDIEEKYRSQINDQKVAMDNEYNAKLTAINNNIKTVIVEKARAMNYDIVVPKSVVLFGGDDITDQIANYIK